MENKVLIQELVKQKLLSDEAAKKLLNEAVLTKKNVDDLIYERRLIDENRLINIKSLILGVPFKKINFSEISNDVLEFVPEETVRNYKAVPLSRSGDMLVVGMVNPDDPKAQEALKFVAKQSRMNLGIYLISPSVWEEALRRYSPYGNEIEQAVKSLNLDPDKISGSQKIIRLEEGVSATSESEDAPIIKIVAETLKEAVWKKASDVHIEPQRNQARIRFRIDGELMEVSSIPLELHQPIISRLKILSNLKIDETRIPQDGRFRTMLLGRDIDFRVATFPTQVGEKMAIRVLDPNVGLKGLKELGLTERNAEILERTIKEPYGMVLITGPTGSGKTTTLYAIMQSLNDEGINIVSLEDPVEYFIDGLNQSQVRPEIGYDFASGLRQILRQDPDVIMVGEIRDNETAALAIHAALTGHIVLSTLHTNNAIGVIPRLIDMRIEPFLLPSSLNLIVAQRMVSKLCQKCKKTYDIPREINEIIKRNLADLPKEMIEKTAVGDSYKIYHSSGCSACNGKGVSGRVALFEILEITNELKNIISHNVDELKILEEAKRQKMVSLRQDGILKALDGLVSIEEVLRETTEM